MIVIIHLSTRDLVIFTKRYDHDISPKAKHFNLMVGGKEDHV